MICDVELPAAVRECGGMGILAPPCVQGSAGLFELPAEFACLHCDPQFTDLLRRVAIPINNGPFCRDLRSFTAKRRAQGCEHTLEVKPHSKLEDTWGPQSENASAHAH